MNEIVKYSRNEKSEMQMFGPTIRYDTTHNDGWLRRSVKKKRHQFNVPSGTIGNLLILKLGPKPKK